MSRYRKIEVRIWSDEKFRSLSSLLPSAQALWFYLLTGPHTGPIPGLYRAGRAAMAEELGWDLEAFAQAFAELEDAGMVRADFQARLVWLPNALKHNKPESPNVVRSWRTEIDLLPECPLKREALTGIGAVLEDAGESFVAAFDEVMRPPKVTPKPSRKPSPNQQQQQQQQQHQDQQQDQDSAPRDPAPCVGEDLPPPPAPDQVATAAELSGAMRRSGIMAQPANPLLIELAARGVSVVTMQAACEEARRAKGPNASIPAGYVIRIIERWQKESKDITVDGNLLPPQRASPGAPSARDASRMAAAASIGLGGVHAGQHDIIDIN
jgi:hypothetical protein